MGSWRFGTSEGKWNEYLMFCVICNFCVVLSPDVSSGAILLLEFCLLYL